MYTNTDYNIHGAIPLLFISPCWFPFAPPSNSLYLLGNPPSCDRIRPPWSQVACKLTSPFSTLSPIPPPSKFPEPRLLSASLWRPQESSFFCPEQLVTLGNQISFLLYRPLLVQFPMMTCSFETRYAGSFSSFKIYNGHSFMSLTPRIRDSTVKENCT
jgi:hypothetical protein